MAASTVPAAKAAILAMLRARPALNEVAITWGEPTEKEDIQPEMIFFDGPVPRLPSWATLGADNPLDEEYTVTLQVRSYTPGDDPDIAEQRCWTLIDEIEQGIRADLRLGGLLRVPIVFDEQTVDAVPQSNDWAAVGLVPLVCTARI